MKLPFSHEGYVNLLNQLADDALAAQIEWSKTDEFTSHMWGDTAIALSRTANRLEALRRRRNSRSKKATGVWPGNALRKRIEIG